MSEFSNIIQKKLILFELEGSYMNMEMHGHTVAESEFLLRGSKCKEINSPRSQGVSIHNIYTYCF